MPATDLQTLLAIFLRDLYAGTVSFPGVTLGGNGTSGAPTYSFTSEPTLGFYRSGAGVITAQATTLALSGSLSVPLGNVITGGALRAGSASAIDWATSSALRAPANGSVAISNSANTIGSQLKADALPTVASGFGTSPAVLAGSTALAGSINVGTGGAATTGALTWNGTAFPSTPFIVCTCSLGAVPTIAVATTTGVTFTTSVAWPASTILNWIAISSK